MSKFSMFIVALGICLPSVARAACTPIPEFAHGAELVAVQIDRVTRAGQALYIRATEGGKGFAILVKRKSCQEEWKPSAMMPVTLAPPPCVPTDTTKCL